MLNIAKSMIFHTIQQDIAIISYNFTIGCFITLVVSVACLSGAQCEYKHSACKFIPS